MKIPPMPTMYMSPEYGEFWPSEPNDFVGGARQCAVELKKMIDAGRPYGLPLKVLIPGLPGIAKSSLALYALKLFNATRWGISSRSGVDITVDYVREIVASLQLSANELFGDYRVFVFQEVDECPRIAQVRLLDAMDSLPRKTAIICTCNSSVKDLEPRFQTRFKALLPTPPTADDLKELIMKWPVPEGIATRIAQGSKGNARLALLEAENWLQVNLEAAA